MRSPEKALPDTLPHEILGQQLVFVAESGTTEGIEVARQLAAALETLRKIPNTAGSYVLASSIVRLMDSIGEAVDTGMQTATVTVSSVNLNEGYAMDEIHVWENALELLGFEVVSDTAWWLRQDARHDMPADPHDIPDWSVEGLLAYQRAAKRGPLEAETTYTSEAFSFDNQEVVVSRYCLLPERALFLVELAPLPE